MELLQIAVLAVVQGVTEFLPISSSGHVIVVAAVFDQLGQPLGEKLTVNIVLHLGTLLAILAFYGRRVWRLLGRDRRVVGLLVVGTLPAVAFGLTLKWRFSHTLESPLLAGLMFPLTGVMLVWAAAKPPGGLGCRHLGYAQALLIGVFQAMAVLPGISRSGATIAAGLGCGLRRKEAAAFSFLLAIPAIGGAGLLEIVSLVRQPAHGDSPGALLLGAALSFAVGLASLWWLIRWIEKGRLQDFAWWVLLLGPVVVAWQWWSS